MSAEAAGATDLAHEDVEDPGGDGQGEVSEEDGEEPGGRVHGGVETLGLEVDVELWEVLLGETKPKHEPTALEGIPHELPQ